AGGGHGDGRRDDVADGSVLAVMPAHDPDAQDLPGPGIVRHLQASLLLDHLFRLLHDLDDPEALVMGQGARLHDPNPVADLALVLLVVGLELGGLPDDLLVARVLLEGLDADDHGLVHAIAHDRPHPHLAHASFHHSADSVLARRGARLGLTSASGSGSATAVAAARVRRRGLAGSGAA